MKLLKLLETEMREFGQDNKAYQAGEITTGKFRLLLSLHERAAKAIETILQSLIGGALFGKDFLAQLYKVRLISEDEVVRMLPELKELVEKGGAESKELVKKKLQEIQRELKVFFKEIEEIKQAIGKDIKCCMDCGEKENLIWAEYYWLCEDCKEERAGGEMLFQDAINIDNI